MSNRAGALFRRGRRATMDDRLTTYSHSSQHRSREERPDYAIADLPFEQRDCGRKVLFQGRVSRVENLMQPPLTCIDLRWVLRRFPAASGRPN